MRSAMWISALAGQETATSNTAQRTGNPAGGVFGVPGTRPRADSFFQMLHNLRGDARVYVFPFGSVLHCILLEKQLFSSRNPRRMEGVQRSGSVKGTACPRSSQTLDREHRWKNASFERARVEWGKKWRRKASSAKNTEWKRRLLFTLYGRPRGAGGLCRLERSKVLQCQAGRLL